MIRTILMALLLCGCAIEPNGTISPFEGLDHGCQIDHQSCK